MTNANDFRDRLVSVLSGIPEILGVAQTGDIHAPLVPGKSDIDLFVICESVPQRETRLQIYRSLAGMYEDLTMEVCAGGIWGYGDIFMVGGIDVMPMYFPAEEMRGYTEEVLAGKHLDKDGRFYPIGRLASIETIHVLYEICGSWTHIIDRVKSHPEALFRDWYASEIGRMIDEEDLGRAGLRHEVLFYHQVVEEFIDHFLQALYARNNCYFPSRKRTEAAIGSFVYKPENCYQRLLKIVRLASSEDTMDESIRELRALGEELKAL